MTFPIGPKEYERWRRRCVAGVGDFLMLVGIGAGVVMFNPSLAQLDERFWAKLSLMLCGILPPVWFWIEYHYIWLTAPKHKRPEIEVFKYGQQLSRNIWLAFSALLLALYFK